MLLGDAWKGTLDDDRVFTTDDGLPMFPTAPTQWFHKFIKRVELPEVSVHSLRHTYASLMIADEVPIVEISSQLGHARTSTTENVYGHVIASAHAKALLTFDKFDGLLGVPEDNSPQIHPKRENNKNFC
jgi:integrase